MADGVEPAGEDLVKDPDHQDPDLDNNYVPIQGQGHGGKSRNNKLGGRFEFSPDVHYRYIGDRYALRHGFDSSGVEISPCSHHGDHDVEYCLAAAAHKFPGYVDHQVRYVYGSADGGPDKPGAVIVVRVQFYVLLWNLQLSEVGYVVLAENYSAFYGGWGNAPAVSILGSAKHCILTNYNGFTWFSNGFHPEKESMYSRLLMFRHIDGVECAAETIKNRDKLAEWADKESTDGTDGEVGTDFTKGEKKMSLEAYWLL